MVEVFKTNVEEPHQAATLAQLLSAHFAHFRIRFDLEDCDRMLRVEGPAIPSESIVEMVRSHGFHCEILL